MPLPIMTTLAWSCITGLLVTMSALLVAIARRAMLQRSVKSDEDGAARTRDNQNQALISPVAESPRTTRVDRNRASSGASAPRRWAPPRRNNSVGEYRIVDW